METSELVWVVLVVVAFTAGLAVFLPIVARQCNIAFADQQEFIRTYFLEPVHLRRILPSAARQQQDRVSVRIALLFLLLCAVTYFAVPESVLDSGRIGERIFFSVFFSIALGIGLLGGYSLFSNHRIDERLVKVKPFVGSNQHPSHKPIKIVMACCYILIFLQHAQSSASLIFTATGLLLGIGIVMGCLGLAQPTVLCSNGIRIGLCFSKWDEIEWCRWYPEESGLLIGFKPSKQLRSWAIVHLQGDARNRGVPLLKANLSDKQIESVAEVLGLEKPPDSENLSDQPKSPHLVERN
jgi:hypothetical protein